MSSNEQSLIPRDHVVPLDEVAQRQKAEAVAALLQFLVEGGSVFLDVVRSRAQSKAAWDETNRKIEMLDAETAAFVRKLEAQMAGEREKTRRFQLLLDCIAGGAASGNEDLARSLGKAVELISASF